MCRSHVSILFLLACVLFVSCGSSKHAARDKPEPVSAHRFKKKDRARLVDYASKQLGAPYRWGGTTPKGFDCSGFTSYCYAHFGVELPRTSAAQAKAGEHISRRKARPGDLIFFKGPNRKDKKVGHVGIVVSGKRRDIKFIHAADNGIITSYLSQDYFSERFKTIRRVGK